MLNNWEKLEKFGTFSLGLGTLVLGGVAFWSAWVSDGVIKNVLEIPVVVKEIREGSHNITTSVSRFQLRDTLDPLFPYHIVLTRVQ